MHQLNVVVILATLSGLCSRVTNADDITCQPYNDSAPVCPENFQHTETCRFMDCNILQAPMVPPNHMVLLSISVENGTSLSVQELPQCSTLVCPERFVAKENASGIYCDGVTCDKHTCCECITGYSDSNCSTNVDDCASNPCQNGGQCTDGLNAYTCACATGWDGDNCVNSKSCTLDGHNDTETVACQNGGVANGTTGNCACTCPVGASGDVCDACAPGFGHNASTGACELCDVRHFEYNKDASVADANGGSCAPASCPVGKGWNASIPQDILDNVAGNVDPEFNCMACPEGTYSASADTGQCVAWAPCGSGRRETQAPNATHDRECEDIDECAAGPCQNGATCTDGTADYTCTCLAGWEGKNCTVDIDECAAAPCWNGATCYDSTNDDVPPNDYACACLAGWEGKNCTVDIDECAAAPCHNGATCYDSTVSASIPPNAYNCQCVLGYEGKNCTTDVNECLENPCQNAVICQDSNNDSSIAVRQYRCTCQTGWTGTDCNVDIDECANNPCKNDAVCTESFTNTDVALGQYLCTCQTGWTGQNCQINIDDCDPDPCKNGATCTDGVNTYTCTCIPGYSGTTCETNIDDCDPDPCQNGATCFDAIADYACACAAGWEGKNCTADIDECATSPCWNGATCYDSTNDDVPPNDYACACLAGWEGKNCTVDIDECAAAPCHNGATCYDSTVSASIPPNAYNCQCVLGYEGKNCTTDIDECAAAPCHNGATCYDSTVNASIPPNAYNCQCVLGYDGDVCDACAPGFGHNASTGACELCDVRHFEYNKDASVADANGGSCAPASCPVGMGWNANIPQDILDNVAGNVDPEFNCMACPEGTYSASADTGQCIAWGTCAPGQRETQTPNASQTRECENIDECAVEPCQNGATCTDGIADYTCACAAGWEDKNCTTNIDDCAANPCVNGAACTDLVNDYTCTCAAGWEDKNCTTNIDECDPNPCQNSAQCFDAIADYACACKPGWVGKNCTADVNECLENPCQNAVICQDSNNDSSIAVGQYRCTCQTGWTGTDCDVDINECANNPCKNDAVCTESFTNTDVALGQYLCTCQTGWTGQNCQINIDDCDPDPCKNGATCTDGVNTYTCTCIPGYSGTTCETNIDECDPNPCKNDATCTDGIADYTCTCAAGWEDKNCTTNIDECDPDPCKNNAQCFDAIADYACACAAGWEGKNCTTDIDECLASPCQNGAICTDSTVNASIPPNAYNCQCVLGYEGDVCDACAPGFGHNASTDACELCDVRHFEYNKDASVADANGGSCAPASCPVGKGWNANIPQDILDNVAGNVDPEFNCMACPEGTYSASADTGQCVAWATCDLGQRETQAPNATHDRECEDIDECAVGPCHNGATCTDGTADYTCTCAAGWEGKNCTTNIDDCAANPCVNGAACTDLVNDYTCTCLAGWEGKNCTTNIDECDPNPCNNGATCTDGTADYTCTCLAGWEGKNCTTNIDECDPNPCNNGATCTDGTADYTCTCLAGWEGKNCTTNIDECDPNPCVNAAACTDLVNDYTCTCLAGWEGKNCTTNIDDCDPNPCNNGATCTDGIADYTCACAAGWEDKNCTTNIDDCDPDPCKNNAQCFDGIADYACACAAGWEDKNCTTDVNECLENPCQNAVICQDSNNDSSIAVRQYLCTCQTGWTGTDCDVDINECANNPCKNDAVCTESFTNTDVALGQYLCTCQTGWTGQNCQINIDDCDPDPCKNGATCTDGVNTYTCTCIPGYSGTTCETNIDDCDPDPCQNGATCFDAIADYACACAAGWEGKNCTTDIDECLSAPCQNGGNCTDSNDDQSVSVNDYACACVTGYEGKNCHSCAPGFGHNASTGACELCDVRHFLYNIHASTTDANGGSCAAAACPVGMGWNANIPQEIVDNVAGNIDPEFNCVPCPGGTYSASADTGQCIVWATCGLGQRENQAPNTTHDRVCGSCEAGTFNGNENHADTSCSACGADTFQGDTGQPNCRPVSVCSAGHKQTRAPNTTHDRVCGPCEAGTYQDETGQSSCHLVTMCSAGQRQTQAPNTTHDRVCGPCEAGTFNGNENHADTSCSACGADTFQGESGQPNCRPVSVCSAGHKQTRAPNATHDRMCGSCEAGTYQDEPGQSSCHPVATCAPGEKQTRAPNATHDRVCGPCEAGTFNGNENHADASCSACGADTFQSESGQSSCHTVSTCAAGQKQTQAPNATHDRVCGACEAGTFNGNENHADTSCTVCGADTFQGDAGQSSCHPVSVCSAGQRQTRAPNTTHDRVCGPCEAGTFNGNENHADTSCSACGADTFQSESGQSSCHTVSTCAAGQRQTQSPNTTHDRVCGACEAGTFNGNENHADTSCTVWATCPAGQRSTQEPSAILNRICEPCPTGAYNAHDNDENATCIQCPAGYKPTNNVGISSERGVTGTTVTTGATGCADFVGPVISSGDTATTDENNDVLVVYVAVATDTSGTVTLSLEPGSYDATLFVLNSSSGEVSLLHPPEADVGGAAIENQEYNFTVVATDGVGNRVQQTVTLTVTDVDDTEPTITSNTTSDNIDENSGSGQVVYIATADDSLDVSGGVTFSLGDGSDESLGIDATSGVVTLNESPDHETQSRYDFVVVATDDGGNSASQPVTLTIIDIDDTSPTITSGDSADAAENSGSGQVVYTALADDSGDISGGVTFSLKDGSDAALSINGTTGAVTLTHNPDHETQTQYTFTVVVTDFAANPAAEQAVLLRITDLDEVAPIITSTDTVWVDNKWGLWSRDAVYTTAAHDDPSDETSACCAFSLADSEEFRIDGETGKVYLLAQPVHAMHPEYNFTVNATDTAGHSVSKQVRIIVCRDGFTAKSQCQEDIRAEILEEYEAKQALGEPRTAVSGHVSIVTDVDICTDETLDEMRRNVAIGLRVPESNVLLTCSRKNNARRLGTERRLSGSTYEITFVITTNVADVLTITATLQDSETFAEVVAQATGEPLESISILSVNVATENGPEARADTYHERYERAAKVYRGLAFPIPTGIGMTGAGELAGTISLSPGIPIPVRVQNAPTPGVTGCQPLMSFYTQVRDKLVATSAYSISQMESNTGDQSELEGLRTDIENAQKDVHSVGVFCGDVAKALKLRRDVYHSYTSAWAAMKFGAGKLPVFRHRNTFVSHSDTHNVFKTTHTATSHSSWKSSGHSHSLAKHSKTKPTVQSTHVSKATPHSSWATSGHHHSLTKHSKTKPTVQSTHAVKSTPHSSWATSGHHHSLTKHASKATPDFVSHAHRGYSFTSKHSGRKLQDFITHQDVILHAVHSTDTDASVALHLLRDALI